MIRPLNSFWKIFILSCIIIIGLNACNDQDTAKSEPDIGVLKYVDPFIGTGFHGHTFPGPVMPNGMVQLSPDTKLNGWDASSGYHNDDRIIYGFSHTHLSGTGIGDMGDILFLPFTGEVDKKPIATFEKENESAEVGKYEVQFSNYDVSVNLGVTPRVGIQEYTYSGEKRKRLLLDVGHILQRTWGHDNISNSLEFVDETTIRGLKHSAGWANDHKVYFYAKFSKPYTIDKVFVDGLVADGNKSYSGKNVYTFLNFETLKEGERVEVKVSISAVDGEGAKNNMEQELPGWGIENVQQNTQYTWKKALDKIEVQTQNKEHLKTFYTALYHTMIAPMTYQDVDGRFRGMDKKVHKAKEGSINYTVYSLWDTFRALHPLMTIIDEPKSADWVNNLIQKYEEGGLLPMWPLASNYTGTMVGYPAVANIADALTKGIKGIDTEKALRAAVTSASYRPELVADSSNPRKKRLMTLYNKFVNEGGYIPADRIVKSVSFGLEMAYYDWCIAEIAKLNGNDSLSEVFDKRAKNYQHYFDEETGFMRGKNEDGNWMTPFNPKYSSHEESAYVEGNAWQWTWFVPHDLPGFMNLYDGKEVFLEKLDSLFTTSSEIDGAQASGDITGLIGQYAHGNEPSHHIAYLYSYGGEAYKSQELVDQILSEFYTNEPDGIIGNEDCGQMSAWYVLNAMGFYQIAPGNPEYIIGRPLFDKIKIPLGNGKRFSIIVENNSLENKYVQEVYLNGTKRNTLLFQHEHIKKGSTLKMVMGPVPNKELNSHP